jgi:hypothetical protein
MMNQQAPVDPRKDERDRPEEPDDIPDTPPTEPPPIPIRDPQPEGTPPGPYISRPGLIFRR